VTRADRVTPLAAGDLEALATAAYVLGREDDYLRCPERAHRLYLDASTRRDAVRCALDRPELPAAGGDEPGDRVVWSRRAAARAR
jgi:hypothetical protein